MPDKKEKSELSKILENSTINNSEEWFKSSDKTVIIDPNAALKFREKPFDPTPLIFIGGALLVVAILYALAKVSHLITSPEVSDPLDSQEGQRGKAASSIHIIGILLSLACTLVFVGLRSGLKSAGFSPSEAITAAVLFWVVIIAALYLIKYLFTELMIQNSIIDFFKSILGKIWLASTISWILCLTSYVMFFQPFGYGISKSEWNLIHKLAVLPPILAISVIFIFLGIVRQK